MTDVLVVGSGAGGVHAARALVDRGLSVALVDHGNQGRRYAGVVPERPWTGLRRSDPAQHRYFLGDRFEGVPLGAVRVGAQLTPPRQFVGEDADEFAPVEAPSFAALQSLARGGLASAWGAGVFPFLDEDLEGMPLGAAELEPHHEEVARRIGVSGARDDLLEVLGECRSMMPALEPDSGAEAVLRRYRARRERFRAQGLTLGVTRLAAVSREHEGRGPHPYLDLDFYADAARAVWRPALELEELRKRQGFRLLDRRHALRFEETARGLLLHVQGVDTGAREEHEARALVLAAGTLGTARLVLASLGLHGRRVPLLCNPYTYTPVLNLGMLGREPRERRHSLAQLTLALRAAPDRLVLAQYYSYRSLLLFKLVKESPLGRRDSIRLFRLLQPLLGIVGIHHEERPSPLRNCRLEPALGSGPGRLVIEYSHERAELRRREADERRLLSLMRRLGCVALRRIRTPAGSAIHYAGTFPMREAGGELSCDGEGRLRETRAVYLADGSLFPRLPAKGLTFTLMALADRIGARLAERLS